MLKFRFIFLYFVYLSFSNSLLAATMQDHQNGFVAGDMVIKDNDQNQAEEITKIDSSEEIYEHSIIALEGSKGGKSVYQTKYFYVIGAVMLVTTTVIAYWLFSNARGNNPGLDSQAAEQTTIIPDVVGSEQLGNSMMSDITAISNFDEIDPFSNHVTFDEKTIVTRKRGNLSQTKYSKRLSQKARSERERKEYRRDPNLFQGS